MRIGIVAWDLEDPDSPELTRVGADLGHDTTMFFLEDVGCRSVGSYVEPVVKGVPVADFDVVISRGQIHYENAQLDHERYSLLCSVPGVTVVDPADAYLNAESKLGGLQRLSAAGLPIAPTRTCANLTEVADALAEWGTIVLKPSFGLGGRDVERIYDLGEDRPTVEVLLKKYQSLICQPYLPHPDGDVRVLIIGDEAVLTYNRVPAPDGWKANFKSGATSRLIPPDPDLVAISRKAAKVMGISIAGLDFLPTPDGYRIIEINTCPGWTSVGEAGRRRVCEAIIDLAVSRHESRSA
jgi:RimK family alpha-L-glutamate ligase